VAGFDDLAGLDATGADVDALGGTVHQGTNPHISQTEAIGALLKNDQTNVDMEATRSKPKSKSSESML
jgi:hypothetical protein